MKLDSSHHRRSIRLRGYDYTQPGAYFVTIVTAVRACLFGKIVNGEMRLSDRGQIAQACWRDIPKHFLQTELGAFVVMPNHVHGILVLHDRWAAIVSPPVGARHGVPLPGMIERFGRPVRGSLATIIRQYKSSVTRHIVRNFGGLPHVWQRNYHEHIIRNADEWNRIHLYIEANPSAWARDEENPVNFQHAGRDKRS